MVRSFVKIFEWSFFNPFKSKVDTLTWLHFVQNKSLPAAPIRTTPRNPLRLKRRFSIHKDVSDLTHSYLKFSLLFPTSVWCVVVKQIKEGLLNSSLKFFARTNFLNCLWLDRCCKLRTSHTVPLLTHETYCRTGICDNPTLNTNEERSLDVKI